MTKQTKLIVSVILISLGVVCRLLPHLWNFAPIAAITLFAGFYLGWRYAIILPLLAMTIGDFFIGFYDWKLMLVVYGSFALIGLAAGWLKKYKSLETVAASSILASVIFFLATNWAVWQFSPWYAKSLSGLINCYTLALPFFRNTMLGDLFYTAVLFGAYEAVIILAKQKVLNVQTVKNS